MLRLGGLLMAARLTTSYRREAHLLLRPGLPEDDDRVEAWTHAEDWDTPARRVHGHPDLRVRVAYTSAWAEAVRSGASLEFAHEYANQAADLAAEEIR